MKKKTGKKIFLKEFAVLLPFYIGMLALLTAAGIIFWCCGIGDHTLLVGAAVGTAVSAANFILMGLTAEKAVRMTEKAAKMSMNAGYAARYISIFVILGALMYFKIINPVTALLPLFVPKIGYTVQAFKEKSEF